MKADCEGYLHRPAEATEEVISKSRDSAVMRPVGMSVSRRATHPFPAVSLTTPIFATVLAVIKPGPHPGGGRAPTRSMAISFVVVPSQCERPRAAQPP
jgi:hypothetical protein